MSIPKKSLLSPSVQPKVATNFTQVTATTTVSKLVRENSLRKELIVTNTSGATLFVMLGNNLPSSTNYTIALATGAVFVTASTDALNGVWASAGGGGANITEEL